MTAAELLPGISVSIVALACSATLFLLARGWIRLLASPRTEFERLHGAIARSAGVASIGADSTGMIHHFSAGAERLLGHPAHEVIGKLACAALFDPDEVRARATALSEELGLTVEPGFQALVLHASRGSDDVFPLSCVRKDGSRFPAVLSVNALHGNDGKIIGYLLVGIDNSSRHPIEEVRLKLEQRLLDHEFFTRSLVESNIDAMLTINPKGVITEANKQTETLTGYTREKLIGTPFQDHFTDPARAGAGLDRVLQDGQLKNYELSARSSDGNATLVSCNATTFNDREQRLRGVFVAARDITELRRFERVLQQKNVELHAASRMKSEFLANMSHELRTPLNAIIGFSEVLRSGMMGELGERQRAFLGDIFDSGNQLLRLINDILDLSKVEAGMMLLDLERADVVSLLASSLSAIAEKSASREIRIDLEAAADVGTIELDERKVKQIVFNLLSNAVKFTQAGGHVSLRAHRVGRDTVGQLSGSRPGRSVPLADNEHDAFLEISVTDDGIGIPPESLDRLFQAFNQVDGGLARKFAGSGLGLAMVKVLVELHGGTVAVESETDAGSRFTVWIPDRSPKEDSLVARENAAIDPRRVHGGTRTALMVEDDPKSAELIRVQLEAEGFTVLHATSAESALTIAPAQSLSLITLDINLPDMDGWEFLEILKKRPDLRRIPVVIISIAGERNRGFSLGAAAVMQKPISRVELCESLADLGLFPVADGRSLRVLVVDDDRKAVDVMATRLTELASTVLRAYGGREAIDVARVELPDLIVLDLMMPEVSGFDVVSALNERAETARIPVLIVTAKDLSAEDRAKLHGSVAGVVEKSEFDLEAFSAEVRRAMSGRQEAV